MDEEKQLTPARDELREEPVLLQEAGLDEIDDGTCRHEDPDEKQPETPGEDDRAAEPVKEETEEKEREEKEEQPEDSEEEEEEVPERPDYDQELVEILRSDLPDAEKKDRLADYHHNDIASALSLLTREERIRLYRMLGMEEVSEVFAYLDDPAEYLAELDVEKAADIVEKMDADDAIDILEELDDAQAEEIMRHMDEESRADISLIKSYDDDEIGSKMTTNFIAIVRGLTVKQAMRSLVDQAADNDNLGTIYVLEPDGVFHGAITLQDLIIAREGTDLEQLVTTSYPYVYDKESVDECIEQLKDYSEDSIPVLDTDKHLLGVITSQDLVEVVDEEMGEDYAKLAGLTAEEDLNETIGESMKKRIPWLVLLMMLGLGVSSVIGVFEPVMQQLTLIVTFQSLILDMAGNVGTQSLAVTIRVLTDENLTAMQKLKLVWKEIRVGFANGLLLGAISCVFAGFYIHFAKDYAWGPSFAVSGCIGLSLLVAMIISSMMGTVIPMFFKKIKVDPAVASGPLIPTVTDLVAVVTYYGMAWLLLLNVLHMGA